MQRDAYAALIKKKHKVKLPVNIVHVDGSCSYERVFDEVFTGYKLRRIVLMTNMAAVPPGLPRLSHDIAVESFATLKRIHQPYFTYRLMPLRCSCLDAFLALQCLCNCAGSPFCIDDRRDPTGLRLRFAAFSSTRASVCDFFRPHMSSSELALPLPARKLPIPGVEFDGVLLTLPLSSKVQMTLPEQATSSRSSGSSSSSSVGSEEVPPPSEKQADPTSAAPTEHYVRNRFLSLLSVHELVTEKTLQERSLVRDFFNSPLYANLGGNTELHADTRSVRHQYHVLASKKPIFPENLAMRRKLIRNAQEKNMILLERASAGEYKYCM